MLSAQLGSKTCDIECLVPGALPLFFTLVETGEYGTGRKLEITLAQFVFQLVWVGGQVAVWAQLDPGVASFDYFIQEAVPRDLLRVIGEPDAPGIRCGSDAQARVFTGDGGGFGIRRYRGGHCCSLLCGQAD